MVGQGEKLPKKTIKETQWEAERGKRYNGQ
jgi:hypothetical protein